MVKKTGTCLLALMMCVAIFAGCKAKTSVTVQEIRDDSVTLEKVYQTDLATLEELLEENAEELGATLTDSEYGKFVEGMDGYVADASKNEYFAVLVNDTMSDVGISQIKLEDGKTYQFRLSTF